MNEPTAARIDHLCDQYVARKQERDDADEALAKVSSEILTLVNQYGKTVGDGDKSLRLEGKLYQATSIGGVTTEIDERGVVQLKLELMKAGCGSLLKKFFITTTRYALADGALKALGELPAKAPKNFANLFHACMSFKPKKSRLDVKPLGGKAKAR